MTSIIIGSFVLVSVAGALLLETRRKKIEAKHHQIRTKSEEAGMNEPASLHPVIDPSRCIGSAACVASCPEGKVLGVVDGRATLIVGSKCVGHGRCTVECPVDAIRLVFGTSERGVDIPHVSADFESNVDRLYIVGELGGMGLVRNAVRQGVDATKHLSRRLKAEGPLADGTVDVIVVGAGPAGVAAAITAKEQGLSFRLFDRESKFGGSILHFPRRKLVMTEPMQLPAYGPVKAREIPKEELLGLLQSALDRAGVAVECGREVRSVKPGGEGSARRFQVALSDGTQLVARAVMLAIGRRGMPNKLGVPGEELPKVAYSLLEPELYRGQRALVVGGGNSAVEAAVALAAEEGTHVTLSYRRAAFPRIAEKNRQNLDDAVAAGRVRMMLESNVTQIADGRVVLKTASGEAAIDNDAVFVFAGGVLPVDFLRDSGIRVEKKYGEP